MKTGGQNGVSGSEKTERATHLAVYRSIISLSGFEAMSQIKPHIRYQYANVVLQ